MRFPNLFAKRRGFGAEDSQTAARRRLVYLSFLTLGIVFGDIGTSPLYAVSLALAPLGHLPTPKEVLGVISLVVWALILVICFKYETFVLRADNRGEGGILALMALIRGRSGHRYPESLSYGKSRRKALIQSGLWVLILGTFGACLLYGDGMITPAISVLSAVQGLNLITPGFQNFILPITCVILFLLFLFQKRGTEKVSMIFSPLMCLWFVVLALTGAISIVKSPMIFLAFNPGYAVFFFMHHRIEGLFTLGAVFLAVTGGEVLYADIGHFGANPVRWGWFLVALPALLLNYLGQGAMILRNPSSAPSTVYGLVPHSLLYPMVILATIATVIASQAAISGAFSLISQSVALNMSPRMRILRTSRTERGQVYVPFINTILMIATIVLVLSFGSSSALGGAYGIAISTTMLITTLLMFVVMRRIWHWKLFPALLLTAAFLVIDVPFWAANMLKIDQGGWVPLAVALVAFAIMRIWTNNREQLIRALQARTESLPVFLDRLGHNMPHRVPGTAVFLAAPGLGVPPMLNNHLKYNQVLHEQILLLSVITTDEPMVMPARRIDIVPLGYGIYQVRLYYGFKQEQPILESLKRAADRGLLQVNPDEIMFYVGRETLVMGQYRGPLYTLRRWVAIHTRRRRRTTVSSPRMAEIYRPRKVSLSRMISEHVFVWMHRNALRATDFFQIPDDRTVEIGTRLQTTALGRDKKRKNLNH